MICSVEECVGHTAQHLALSYVEEILRSRSGGGFYRNRHNRADMGRNSKRLWLHAQDPHKLMIGKVPSRRRRREPGRKSHPSLEAIHN